MTRLSSCHPPATAAFLWARLQLLTPEGTLGPGRQTTGEVRPPPGMETWKLRGFQSPAESRASARSRLDQPQPAALSAQPWCLHSPAVTPPVVSTRPHVWTPARHTGRSACAEPGDGLPMPVYTHVPLTSYLRGSCDSAGPPGGACVCPGSCGDSRPCVPPLTLRSRKLSFLQWEEMCGARAARSSWASRPCRARLPRDARRWPLRLRRQAARPRSRCAG